MNFTRKSTKTNTFLYLISNCYITMGENGIAIQGKGFVGFDSVLKIVFESFFFKVVSYNGSKSILKVELYFKNSYIILKRVTEKKK